MLKVTNNSWLVSIGYWLRRLVGLEMYGFDKSRWIYVVKKSTIIGPEACEIDRWKPSAKVWRINEYTIIEIN